MSQGSGARPIQFIELNAKKGFVICEQAETFLKGLQGKKVGVISVVGKYRTGKSYLLNKVLLDLPAGKRGFEVGPTTNACTHGIWIWSETIKSKNADEGDMEVIVMDTEGFGAVNEGHNHDTRIFLFSILLSSLFVYNSVGSIDENALQALSLIVNLAKEVQKSEKGFPGTNNQQLSDEDIRENFPYFLWVLRDFSLKLIDESNKPISTNEYLENALQPVKGNSEAIEGKNKIRRLLKHFFAQRECSTLIRPVEKEAQLQSLDELGNDELRVEFLNQADKIRKIAMLKTPVKSFNRTKLDGPQLLQLAKAYIESINSGKAPSLDYAWNYMKSFENEKIFGELMEQFRSENKAIKSRGEIDVYKRRISEVFRDRKMGDDDENAEQIQYFDDLIDRELNSMYDKHKKTVKVAILNKVNADFDALKDDILHADDLTMSMCEDLVRQEQQHIKSHFRDQLEEDEIEKLVEKNLSSKKTEILSIASKRISHRSNKLVKDAELQKLQELNAMNQSKNTLQKRLQDKEEELAGERAKNAKLNVEYVKALTRANELEMELDAMKGRIESQRDLTSRARLEEENEQLKLDVRIALDNNTKLAGEKNKEIALLGQKVALLEADNRNLSTICAQQEDIVHATQTKFNELEARFGELSKTASQNAVTLLEHQVVVDKHHIDRLNAKIEANEDLCANYEKIITELNTKEHSTAKNFEVLKYAIENALTSKDGYIGELSDKLDEIKGHTAQMVALESARGDKTSEVLKYAHIVRCAKCSKFFSTVIFVKHLKECLDADEHNISAFDDEGGSDAHDALSVVVEQAVLNEDKKSLKNNATKSNYVSYVLSVDAKSRNWRVSRRFIDFYQLVVDLKGAMPSLRLPASCYKLTESVEDIWGLIGGKGLVTEDRKQLLQAVVDELSCIKQVRQHIVFRKFVDELSGDVNAGERGRGNNIPEDKYYLQKLSRESL